MAGREQAGRPAPKGAEGTECALLKLSGLANSILSAFGEGGSDDPRASVPCEIIPSQEFYTYEDKYLLDKARVEIPAKLSPEQTAEIQRLAVGAFKAVNCEGMARVDFLMDGATGQFYVNEINTIPGFTSISGYPKMWEHSGVPYPKLLDCLIELALKRAERSRQTQYAR